MTGSIVIVPMAGNVFVARDEGGLSAQGATPELALAKLREETERRQAEFRDQATVRPPDGDHPLMKWAGTLPDDELTRMWREAVDEYRREVDADSSLSVWRAG